MELASKQRIFLLSPAFAGGRRAKMILSDRASFPLARKLRSREGTTIAEVFTFLSGLYFRGKIAYAEMFARASNGISGVFVITPTRGLVDARAPIGLKDLKEFAEIDIDKADPRYRKPLEKTLRCLARRLAADGEVIFLGSIASGKYVEILLEHFRDQLWFPADFVGRGDMSRGGLMLRCAQDREELRYIPVVGAVRKGKRPPRLSPRRDLKDSSRMNKPGRRG